MKNINYPVGGDRSMIEKYGLASVIGKNLIHIMKSGQFEGTYCGLFANLFDRSMIPEVAYTVCAKCAQAATR